MNSNVFNDNSKDQTLQLWFITDALVKVKDLRTTTNVLVK